MGDRTRGKARPLSTEVAFRTAIRERPDDDTPRLIYADWLDDRGDAGRAEFIRAQIEAERHGDGSPERARLTARAVELLSKHAAAWSAGYGTATPAGAVRWGGKAALPGERGLLVRWESKGEPQGRRGDSFVDLWFRRGFVDAVEPTPEMFFSLGPRDIRPAGPLPALHLPLCRHWGPALGTFADLARRLASPPLLGRFREVFLGGGFHSTTEEGLRLLATEPALLAKLAGLRLSEDPIGDPVLLQILEPPALTRLRELAIDDTERAGGRGPAPSLGALPGPDVPAPGRGHSGRAGPSPLRRAGPLAPPAVPRPQSVRPG